MYLVKIGTSAEFLRIFWRIQRISVCFLSFSTVFYQRVIFISAGLKSISGFTGFFPAPPRRG